MKPYRLVEIDWVDSSSTGQTWRQISSFGAEARSPLQCLTVGYIVAETQLAVTLVMNLAYEKGQSPHSAGNDMTIPKCSILKIKTITQKR
jgi:hypothetical protein